MGTIITTKMDKKYLIIAVAVLALGCIGTLQAFTHLETQEPQEIRGIVVDEHDAAWYEQQQTLWLKKHKPPRQTSTYGNSVSAQHDTRICSTSSMG